MRMGLLAMGMGLIGQGVLAAPPEVLTDIAPVHALTMMVMGDMGPPGLLLPSGADPHDFQLRPSQARALVEAGLIVWMGPELSPWLERGIDGVGTKARSVALLGSDATKLRAFGAADHDHGTEAAGNDPHAWLDPNNARNWLALIAAELSALDPENAATYAANAAKGQAQIDKIEAQVVDIIAPVQGQPFAVFHDAYGYFFEYFGLNSLGSLREGDAAAPSAAHIRDIENRLKSGAALCLFPEANHDSAAAAQLAQASGVRLGQALDPEGTTLTPGAELYGQLMIGLATTLADCLGQGESLSR